MCTRRTHRPRHSRRSRPRHRRPRQCPHRLSRPSCHRSHPQRRPPRHRPLCRRRPSRSPTAANSVSISTMLTSMFHAISSERSHAECRRRSPWTSAWSATRAQRVNRHAAAAAALYHPPRPRRLLRRGLHRHRRRHPRLGFQSMRARGWHRTRQAARTACWCA